MRRIVDPGHCLYSHADAPIPFGAYPRPQTASRALASVNEHDENLLYAAGALTAWEPTREPPSLTELPQQLGGASAAQPDA